MESDKTQLQEDLCYNVPSLEKTALKIAKDRPDVRKGTMEAAKLI